MRDLIESDKSPEQIVQEIGGGGAGSFSFTKIEDNTYEMGEGGLKEVHTEYEFQDGEGNEYRVFFDGTNKNPRGVEIDFEVEDLPDGLTGANQPLKVVQTVVETARDFHESHPDFHRFSFTGMRKPGDIDRRVSGETPGYEQRIQMYLQFIKRQFPEAEVQKRGDTVVLDIPEE